MSLGAEKDLRIFLIFTSMSRVHQEIVEHLGNLRWKDGKFKRVVTLKFNRNPFKPIDESQQPVVVPKVAVGCDIRRLVGAAHSEVVHRDDPHSRVRLTYADIIQ